MESQIRHRPGPVRTRGGHERIIDHELAARLVHLGHAHRVTMTSTGSPAILMAWTLASSTCGGIGSPGRRNTDTARAYGRRRIVE